MLQIPHRREMRCSPPGRDARHGTNIDASRLIAPPGAGHGAQAAVFGDDGEVEPAGDRVAAVERKRPLKRAG